MLIKSLLFMLTKHSKSTFENLKLRYIIEMQTRSSLQKLQLKKEILTLQWKRENLTSLISTLKLEESEAQKNKKIEDFFSPSNSEKNNDQPQKSNNAWLQKPKKRWRQTSQNSNCNKRLKMSETQEKKNK